MKTAFNLRRTAFGFVAASMVAALGVASLPVSVYALGSSGSEGFCSGMSAKAEAANQKVASLSDKVTQAWSQQDQKLTDNFTKVDTSVKEGRKKADSQRQEDFDKLAAKAKTDAQKQAVTTYKSAIEASVTIRRDSFDSIRQTYRQALRDTISDRRLKVSAQQITYKAAVADAFTTAEQSCQNSPKDTAAVRVTLLASLKSAREAYQTDRKSDATVGAKQQELAKARNEAFKTATDTFLASTKAARDALRQSFGKEV
jgi:hypothetical protein